MSSMLRVREGDLFTSGAQTLVNTVNCVGVMGKGIALEFRRRFPTMHRDYMRRCERGEVKLGQPYLYRQAPPPWIINFPTKDHWRSHSRLEDIVAGLVYLKDHVTEWDIESMAVPPLGCGNGGLEWTIVGPILYHHLQRLAIPVELYAPYGTSPQQLTADYLCRASAAGPGRGIAIPNGRIDPSAMALVEILGRIDRQPYHWPVGRVMLQKIVYFATVFGIPTGLRYVRGSYGPFAHELRPLLGKLVNNGLIVERRRGHRIEVEVGPAWEHARQLYADRIDRWDRTMGLVADLMSRMTVHDAEMAATIHFVASRMGDQRGPTESAVLAEVMEWKQRRKPAWQEDEVALMIRHLAMLGVIEVQPTDDLTIGDEALLGLPEAPGLGER